MTGVTLWSLRPEAGEAGGHCGYGGHKCTLQTI